MDQSLCKLTLVCPPDGADRIVELMLEIAPPIAGFTTWTAEGHGYGFGTASVNERVRGRVKRSVIVAVVRRMEAGSLLEVISARSAIPHLTFWTEPVDGFGQMQPGKSSTANVVYLAGSPNDVEEA